MKAGEGFDSSENHPDLLEARGFRESTAEARSLITRLECGTIGSESHLVRMGGQGKKVADKGGCKLKKKIRTLKRYGSEFGSLSIQDSDRDQGSVIRWLNYRLFARKIFSKKINKKSGAHKAPPPLS